MKTTDNLITWHKSLAAVVSKNFTSEAIDELLKGLENLISASSGMVTIFPPAQPPQTTHYRLLANQDPVEQIETYDQGAYLLDPFYRIAVDDKVTGAFTIKDVAPEGFEQSEYYNLFYKKKGFLDEVCILFQLPEQVIVSISVVRHAHEQPFKAADIKQLAVVYPLLKSIIEKWQSHNSQVIAPNLEWQLDNALVKFGSSVLTPRESEILHLVLHGYAIKVIAEKLDNSVETIKHHRKNIYNKLDVSSQSELFYLFIASLKAMPEGSTVDPISFLN